MLRVAQRSFALEAAPLDAMATVVEKWQWCRQHERWRRFALCEIGHADWHVCHSLQYQFGNAGV